jgi:hypothetical protein
MRLNPLVTFALIVAATPTPGAAQAQSESEPDSVVIFVDLSRTRAPFAVQQSGAWYSTRSALERIGIAVVRSSQNIITVTVSAQTVPPFAGISSDPLDPIPDVEWRVSATYAVRGSADYPTRRQVAGKALITTWAAAATTGMRTVVASVVRAHAQRVKTNPEVGQHWHVDYYSACTPQPYRMRDPS